MFHNGYYWEAHEVWERVWNALGRHGPQADFIKGFIKLAAAGVKLGERNPKGVQRHLARAMELLQQSLGQLPELKDRVQIEDWRAFMDGAWSQTRIGLAPPSGQPKVLLPWLPRSD